MPKINFSKVEQALLEGLLKMNARELLHLADLTSMDFNPAKMLEQRMAASPLSPAQTAEALTKALINLQYDIKRIRKHSLSAYKQLGVKSKELKWYFDHPGNLSPEDWKKIKEIRDKIEAYKKELGKQMPAPTDEQLIQTERKKHVRKRFNINEKWIPLK